MLKIKKKIQRGCIKKHRTLRYTEKYYVFLLNLARFFSWQLHTRFCHKRPVYSIQTSVGQIYPLQFFSDLRITLSMNSISEFKFWIKLQSVHSVESLLQHRLLFCCKNSSRVETERQDNLIIPLASLHFTIHKTIFFPL